MFDKLKLYLIGGAVIIGVVLMLGAYWSGRSDGGNATTVKVQKAQIKTIKKVMKANEKIDKQTPFNSSKHDAIDWLCRYTRAD